MTSAAPIPHSETGPFGPPDGARADLDEIHHHFVDFAEQGTHEDLARPRGDSPTRLIVGKKGVGKTVYLRCFRANASAESSVYADHIYHDVPATQDVIRVCELFRPELAAEGWEYIWRRAIMRALVSHLLWAKPLRAKLDSEQAAILTEDYPHLVGTPNERHSVYAEAQRIAFEAKSGEQLARQLRHPDWSDLEARLGEILRTQPPICFYLDSFDERFETAPMYWLQCQKGLCQQVLELYRDPLFGGRLHVVVSVRDLMYSWLLRGEHATRYSGTPHIRVLDWDYPAIKHFLYEKERRLAEPFRMSRSPGILGWLGTEGIFNTSRGVDEKLEDYLLRHTRQIPRDIVQLGNELCMQVQQAKTQGEKELSEDAIRSAVGAVSRRLADEQIAICANHLSSDMMPPTAGRQQISDFYISGIYADTVQDELCDFISKVGKDRFTFARLGEALERADCESLRRHRDPLNVLWLNGLLGYDDPDDAQRRSHFYGARDKADFKLPRDLRWYVFHPIVAHKIQLRVAGEWPVRPFA